MINERREAQHEIEVVMLEQLGPQDHLLRKIDKYIDFSFIRELTKDLYCHTNGRPAVGICQDSCRISLIFLFSGDYFYLITFYQ